MTSVTVAASILLLRVPAQRLAGKALAGAPAPSPSCTMAQVSSAAPRSVRTLELTSEGAPLHDGLLVVEVGTRLVFSMRPNARADLVRAAWQARVGRARYGR